MMELSCTRKICRFITGSAIVVLVALAIFALYKIYCLSERQKELQITVLQIEERLYCQESDTSSMVQELELSYDIANQVSTSLGIITVGIAVFTIFGGILSVFNIMRSKELEEAISKAEKAIENQQELTGARLLQDGLVYVSRHRTYYAARAFEEVIKQVPDTIAALTARYELLSLYADIKNVPIDEYRLRKIREKFDELINALGQVGDKKNPEVCRHLQGDAYFTLGCAYGRCASTYSPPNKNHINVAEWYLKMALKFDNGDVDYHRNLAYTYALACKTNQCKRELEVAIDCAEREPLYKPLVSGKRLRTLFNPTWNILSIEMQQMLNEIFITL